MTQKAGKRKTHKDFLNVGTQIVKVWNFRNLSWETYQQFLRSSMGSTPCFLRSQNPKKQKQKSTKSPL